MGDKEYKLQFVVRTDMKWHKRLSVTLYVLVAIFFPEFYEFFIERKWLRFLFGACVDAISFVTNVFLIVLTAYMVTRAMTWLGL